MMLMLVLILQLCVFSSLLHAFRGSARVGVRSRSLQMSSLEHAPFDDIIPFLSEHIQLSDQLLFVGASTDMCVQLVRAGFGTEKTGFMHVIDANQANLDACREAALADAKASEYVASGKLTFTHCDLTNMPQVCKQSCVDAIVDYGGLDSLLIGSQGKAGMLKCIDHLQDAVRLGNILICLSKIDKQQFCAPFEERFGWVQELDGDPGEISAWYRGKTNIVATKSNFAKLGLKMYVYTNTDNC